MTIMQSGPDWLALLLAGLLIVTAMVNFSGPGFIREEFARWGYPRGFHLVTGLLHLISGIAILVPATRLYGMLLALIVIGAAIATLVYHREFKKLPPTIIFLILIGTWLTLAL